FTLSLLSAALALLKIPNNDTIKAAIIIPTKLLLFPDIAKLINKTPLYYVAVILQFHCNLDTTLSEISGNKKDFLKILIIFRILFFRNHINFIIYNHRF